MDLAGRWFSQPIEETEERGLSRPGRPSNEEEVSASDGQVDFVEEPLAVEGEREFSEVDIHRVRSWTTREDYGVVKTAPAIEPLVSSPWAPIRTRSSVTATARPRKSSSRPSAEISLERDVQLLPALRKT